MGNIKNINIEDCTDCFFNGITDIKNFDSNLLKVGKMSYKKIVICCIKYINIKNIDYESLIYPIFDKVDEYIEESNGNKYFCFYRERQRSIEKIHRTLE